MSRQPGWSLRGPSLVLLLFSLAFARIAPAGAEDEGDTGTRNVRVIETAHLTVYVPADAVPALALRVARAEALYALLCREAGYTPRR